MIDRTKVFKKKKMKFERKRKNWSDAAFLRQQNQFQFTKVFI